MLTGYVVFLAAHDQDGGFGGCVCVFPAAAAVVCARGRREEEDDDVEPPCCCCCCIMPTTALLGVNKGPTRLPSAPTAAADLAPGMLLLGALRMRAPQAAL